MKVWELKWLLNQMPDDEEVALGEYEIENLPKYQGPDKFEVYLFRLAMAEHEKDPSVDRRHLVSKFRQELGNRTASGARL